MKCLVTGGMGFLGSHLVEELLIDRHEVHVIDNLSSNAVEPDEFLKRWPELRFRQQSVVDYLEMDAPGKNFDEIYHCASPVGPVGVLGLPGDIAEQVVTSVFDLQHFARLAEARLCFVSTSEVYGGGMSGLCAETCQPIVSTEASARLEYATSKLAAEVMLRNFSAANGLHAVIVRPFNIAGPRQKSAGGFVLPRFIAQALAGNQLTVYGNGSQIRAFTHVKDVAHGLIAALRSGKTGEVYNIGHPYNKTTILDLAKLVLEVVAGRKPDDAAVVYGQVYGGGPIQFVDPKTLHGPAFAEAPDKFPDANKAVFQLGWHPKFSLRDIVALTVDYMRAVAP